jgi:glycosyltransferase involved in cell wall biosynthesis
MREIILGWIALFPADTVLVAVRSSAYQQARAELPNAVTLLTTRLWPQAVSNAVELGRLGRRVDADAVFAHNFAARATVSGVFVHDVLFQDHPEWFTASERLYFSLMPRTLRHARAVFTSSSSEAERIQTFNRRRLHVPVVPVGLSIGRTLATAEPRNPIRLGLVPRSFVLAVGRLNRRKNLGTIISAAIASNTLSQARPLVIVGEESGASADLPDDLNEWIADGRIIFSGFVAEDELAWMYANASLFVFATLDEGFGLPAIEAIAFGCAAIVSDIPVMREVTAGSSTAYADPTSVSSFANALRDFFSENQAAPEPLQRYSWATTVTAIRSHLLEVSGGTEGENAPSSRITRGNSRQSRPISKVSSARKPSDS